MAMDLVDYPIQGAAMQFVEIEIDPGGAAVAVPRAGSASGWARRRRPGAERLCAT